MARQSSVTRSSVAVKMPLSDGEGGDGVGRRRRGGLEGEGSGERGVVGWWGWRSRDPGPKEGGLVLVEGHFDGGDGDWGGVCVCVCVCVVVEGKGVEM